MVIIVGVQMLRSWCATGSLCSPQLPISSTCVFVNLHNYTGYHWKVMNPCHCRDGQQHTILIIVLMQTKSHAAAIKWLIGMQAPVNWRHLCRPMTSTVFIVLHMKLSTSHVLKNIMSLQLTVYYYSEHIWLWLIDNYINCMYIHTSDKIWLDIDWRV